MDVNASKAALFFGNARRGWSLVIVAFSITAFLVACDPSSKSNVHEKMSQDISALSALIALSPQPAKAKWEQFAINTHFGETGIVAFLQYEKTQRAALELQLIPLDYPLSNVPGSLVRDWFDPKIRSEFVPNDQPSQEFHLDREGYEVTPFSKGALMHGFCYWFGDQLMVYIYSI